jgi:hypothetical protein
MSSLTNSQRLLDQSRVLAGRQARSAIDASARAFWWAEDSEFEEAQHTKMHEIGRWTRQNIGCHLDFDGERYRQTCPIAIAHKRLGFSVGFIGPRACSICGGDLSECSHVRGRAYWVRGGRHDGVDCPVCLRPECQHRGDRLYRVGVVSIVSNVDELREVSMVVRPASPEARLLEIPIETAALQEKFGPRFSVGTEVSCDLCLGGCWGFDGMPTADA